MTTPLRPTGGRRVQMRAATRRRLLEAARTVFASDGFGAPSIRDITSTAGVNRVTFYAHFDSKSAVMAALCTDVVGPPIEDWSRLDEAISDGSRTSIRAWLGTAIGWWQRNADVIPAIREAVVVDEVIAAAASVPYAGLSERVHPAIDAVPAGRRTRARLILQLLLIQLDQVLFERLVRDEGHDDRERTLDDLADIWTAAVASW